MSASRTLRAQHGATATAKHRNGAQTRARPSERGACTCRSPRRTDDNWSGHATFLSAAAASSARFRGSGAEICVHGGPRSAGAERARAAPRALRAHTPQTPCAGNAAKAAFSAGPCFHDPAAGGSSTPLVDGGQLRKGHRGISHLCRSAMRERGVFRLGLLMARPAHGACASCSSMKAHAERTHRQRRCGACGLHHGSPQERAIDEDGLPIRGGSRQR